MFIIQYLVFYLKISVESKQLKLIDIVHRERVYSDFKNCNFVFMIDFWG